MKEYLFKTERLGLRNWLQNDLEPFFKMCQDKEVMNYFPNLLTKEECNNFLERMQKHYQLFGFCYFAVDILETNEFIGFTGIMNQDYKSHFTPSIDIGWRLKRTAWNNGFATEAANACLDYATNKLDLEEIYSVASKVNLPSKKVMKKIGMVYHSDFQHPALLKNEILKNCIVYHSVL